MQGEYLYVLICDRDGQTDSYTCRQILFYLNQKKSSIIEGVDIDITIETEMSVHNWPL